MEFSDLKIFESVAEHGSISKAAMELNYVQSNVTARIKLLEKELNTPLFYRHNRGMTLNAEGRMLLEYTKKVNLLMDEIATAFHDTASPSGLLQIGIVETVIALPTILAAYNRKYPNVELSLAAGVTEQLVHDVLDHKLDGAFVTGPIKHPQIEQVEVFDEKLVLVSSEQTLLTEDLSHKPLLVFNKGCGYRWRLESWLKEEGIVPKQIMAFGTFETIIGSVAAGLGITIIPESTVYDIVKQGQLHMHRIPDKYQRIQTVFIRRKETYVTHSMQQFMNEIEHVRLNRPSHI